MSSTTPAARSGIQHSTHVLPDLLTVPQVAQRMGIHANRVYDLIKGGDLPSVRFSARRIRVRADVLDAWERAGGIR